MFDMGQDIPPGLNVHLSGGEFAMAPRHWHSATGEVPPEDCALVFVREHDGGREVTHLTSADIADMDED